MKYVVKKRNKVFDVIDINYPFKGFKFSSKGDMFKSIIVLDEDLMSKIACNKIDKMIKRLLMIINDAFNSDDDPSGTQIALDEILMVKNSIKNKYNKYLKKEKEDLYLKKLLLLEEEMQFKMINYQVYYEENMGGRSR